jgi:antibiotic biosynthesis monooxygenase (ABM) superfamily enzyme
MESKLTLVVALYLHPGRAAEFEQFEAATAAIMKRHGGLIERRIAIAPDAAGDAPHEVHVVTFPDPAGLAGYRADAALRALADLRERAIRKTVIWSGAALPPFGG